MQGLREDISTRFTVPVFGVDPFPVTDPDFVSLMDEYIGTGADKFRLYLKFPREPEIIAVKERDIGR